MKFLVVLSIAVACVAGASDFDAPIVQAKYESSPEGDFQYLYETGNQIYAQAEGVLKNKGSEYPALEIKGAYKYISPDGTPVEESYIANEAGFQPSGNFIPTSPPIPEAILRSLAYIAAHPPKQESVNKPYSG